MEILRYMLWQWNCERVRERVREAGSGVYNRAREEGGLKPEEGNEPSRQGKIRSPTEHVVGEKLR